jgi:hypothetical protein
MTPTALKVITDDERATYTNLDFDCADYAKDVGTKKLIHGDNKMEVGNAVFHRVF